jgi:hypothetical protein
MDIVDKLKQLAKSITPANAEFSPDETYYFEAASTIQSLSTKNAELESKLEFSTKANKLLVNENTQLQAEIDAIYALPLVAYMYVNEDGECEQIDHISNVDYEPYEFTALVALPPKGEA